MGYSLFLSYIEATTILGYFLTIPILYHQFYRFLRWWYYRQKRKGILRSNWQGMVNIMDSDLAGHKAYPMPRTCRKTHHFSYKPFYTWKRKQI